MAPRRRWERRLPLNAYDAGKFWKIQKKVRAPEFEPWYHWTTSPIAATYTYASANTSTNRKPMGQGPKVECYYDRDLCLVGPLCPGWLTRLSCIEEMEDI
jgi:hypothetical protein